MKLTAEAQEVLQAAEAQAKQLRASQIGTEHLLLALANHAEIWDGMKDALFGTIEYLRIYPERVLDGIGRVPPTTSAVPAGDLPYSSNLKQVLDYAAEEARAMGHYEDVESEHLLLGITRSKDCTAARILSEIGVSLAEVRETVVYLLGWMGRIPTKEFEKYEGGDFE